MWIWEDKKLPDTEKYDPDPAPKRFILLCHCYQAFEPLDAADEIVRDIPVYLVSSQSATWLLGPGQHNIRHVFFTCRPYSGRGKFMPLPLKSKILEPLFLKKKRDFTTYGGNKIFFNWREMLFNGLR